MLKWTKHQQNLQLFHTLSNFEPNPNSPLKTIANNTKKPKKRYTVGHKPTKPSLTLSPSKMPTMTHTLERRLHRRSLDNQLDTAFEERRLARHSLTGNHNKENFGVHFMRNSFGNTSLTALHDLSNGKSPRRSMDQTPPALLNIKRLNTAANATFEMTPPYNDQVRARFSDDFAEENDVTPLSRLRFRNKLKEESLSSSRMGDVTLDRMLDAIIESARKEVKPKCPHIKMAEETETERDFEVTRLDQSIHEMEVRTPQHLKRQRVVRRKNTKNTEKKNKKHKPRESSKSVTEIENNLAKRQQQLEEKDKSFQELSKDYYKEGSRAFRMDRDLIGLTLPNGIPSPDTPLFKNTENHKALLNMETPPQHLTFLVENDDDLQRCSTPTLEEAQSIKRCLSFSCNSDEEEDGNYHNHKRSSVASSIASSTNEQLSGSTASLTAAVRGSVDVSIYADKGMLNVHVIRCRDLQRPNGSTALNAYVKVALIRKAQPDYQGFQRTAVHRHSSRPYFDHCFKFDLTDLTQALEDIHEDDRLQMAVWHRDRQFKRSEFLGCISFPLSTLLQQEINGSYKLQTQQCLNKPQPAIPVQQQQHQPPTLLSSLSAAATLSSSTTSSSTLAAQINHYCYQTIQQPQQHPQQHHHHPQYNNHIPFSTMATTMTQLPRNPDDAVSIDSSMAAPQMGADNQPMILSKKALHQRDADENLFLRFLELDPPPTEVVPPQGTPQAGAGARRLSNTKPVGRTPFTMTKKLTRTAERGFGFSIVWTHPPRVEKVEPGLSADRCGILPGDYVIFVDKHNVVTMPEADVLNLIRSQGATLTLEIFRRSGSGTNAGAAGSSNTTGTGTNRSLATTLPMNGKTSRLAASGTSINNTVDEVLCVTTTTMPAVNRQQQHQQQIVSNQNRPSTACSVNTTSSLEAAKRRLNLPQVTFSKESIAPITDNRRRFMLQLISREQNYMSALHFGMQRFVQPLQERKDLITPNDHRTLFQNMDELLRISEDVLEQLCHDDQEPQMNFASRVYLSKTTAICAAYKKYCNGIKRADCVLVNKSRQTGSEFVNFITEPPVPRKRPDLTMFIHRPLQHFREILKLMQLLASNCHVDTEEHKNFTSVINELQAAYREITVTSGLMEPLGEGRPLLTLQDLESRMVFTKCKPFTLAVQGRQWIFGGDLSRVEGRSVKPYWTLLFSDIIVFAKVSRDRVLFITEEPIPIANIVDSCFHMRKKTTEFRLTVDPNGRLAESPTGYCAPDLTKTPKKGARRKSLVLRAPSLELKAVWQSLLQRQIFLVNAALGSTPLSSPLDSPDVLNTLVPLSDIGIASASIGSIKLSSMDSINLKNQQHHHQQQVRLMRSKALSGDGSGESGGGSFENLQRLASTLVQSSRCSTRMTQTTQNSVSCSSQTNSPATYRRTLIGCMNNLGPPGDSVTSLRSLALGRKHLLDGRPLSACRAYNASNNNSSTPLLTCSGSSLNTQTICSNDHLTGCKCLTAIPEHVTETGNESNNDYKAIMLRQNCSNKQEERYLLIDAEGRCCVTTASLVNIRPENGNVPRDTKTNTETCYSAAKPDISLKSSKLLEFSLSSVGRSFIDESDILPAADSILNSLTTPDTPTPNLSPSVTSNLIKDPDTFSNDFVPSNQNNPTSGEMGKNSESSIPLAQFGGSWDLLELDLNLHEVNLDTCYDTDVEEYIFHGDDKELLGDEDDEEEDVAFDIEQVHHMVDDPFGVLPTKPTPPDSLDL